MAEVELKKVNKIYDGGNLVVADVNFTVRDKEFVVLVGPSGCGKTTTLRMIAGLEEITSGEILIDGGLVNSLPPKDRDIAMVFQNYALYPHMTVFENMAFGLKLKKVDKNEIEKRVKEAAKILDLEEYLDRKPKALSGGQRQRVAVGRAIVRKPKVFLFDEPLSNLDAKLRVQMRTEISKLHKQLGATMIYVTHDQTEAMTMGDRIVVMKDGIINQVDTPMNLYNNPVNKFVAGFIGSPSMNFIEGKIIEQNGIKFCSENKQILIPLEIKKNEQIPSFLNKPVYLGIRPENIDLNDEVEKKFQAYQFELQTEIVEPMGNETLYHFIVENVEIIARYTGKRIISRGDWVKISIRMDDIFLFDHENGNRIL